VRDGSNSFSQTMLYYYDIMTACYLNGPLLVCWISVRR